MSDSSEKVTSAFKILALFGSFMLVGILFLVWLGSPPPNDLIGQPISLVNLQPLVNADQTVLNTDIQDKVVLLHFWGTWCGPCRREFPEFAKVEEALRGHENCLVLSVSCSPGPENNLEELTKLTQAYVSEHAPEMPVYCDQTAITRGKLSLLLPGGSFGYPTTILVNQRGFITKLAKGYRPGEMEQFKTAALKLLDSQR